MSDVAGVAHDAQADEGGIAVRLDGVVKRFGDVVAVDGVDLEVREGEFFSMLGPSGSGKTTCLRMIAGFEQPTEGRILLGGAEVSLAAPYERDVNTVFQDYALFPHMTVAENVGYGLMVAQGRRRATAVGVSTTRSRWCVSPGSRIGSRGSSRGVSDSAWRSPGRS